MTYRGASSAQTIGVLADESRRPTRVCNYCAPAGAAPSVSGTSTTMPIPTTCNANARSATRSHIPPHGWSAVRRGSLLHCGAFDGYSTARCARGIRRSVQSCRTFENCLTPSPDGTSASGLKRSYGADGAEDLGVAAITAGRQLSKAHLPKGRIITVTPLTPNRTVPNLR